MVAAGDGVDDFAPGTDVYGLQYSNDGNVIRLNSSCCRSLESEISLPVSYLLASLLQLLLTNQLREIVSFTEAFCQATHALVHLARLQCNEVTFSGLIIRMT